MPADPTVKRLLDKDPNTRSALDPRSVLVPDPEEAAKGLNLETPEGRLKFWHRLRGGVGGFLAPPTPMLFTLHFIKWISDPVRYKLLFGENRERTPTEKLVRECVSEQYRGRWVQAGPDHIVYTDDGLFANGNGRLLTSVISGLPQIYLVRGPIPGHHVGVIDVNKARTPSDMIGMGNPKRKDQRPLLLFDTFKVLRHHLLGGTPRFSPTMYQIELLQERFALAYETLYPVVKSKRIYMPFRQPSVLAAFVYAYRALGASDKEDLMTLWRRVANNDRLIPRTAEHTLHHLITSTNPTTAPQALSLMERALHGIQSSLQGRYVKKLARKRCPLFEDEDFTNEYTVLQGH